MEEKAQRIVAAAIRLEGAGTPVEDSELGKRFPELMPQLRDRLQRARGILDAANKAGTKGRLPSSDSSGGAVELDRLGSLQTLLPQFEILERLDAGGQGAVYRAVQRGSGRTIALKFLLHGPLSSERQRQRFAREIDLVSELHHPNIVTLFESGTANDLPYFAMEYIAGLPIDDHLSVNPHTAGAAVRLFAKVCRAVSYAHQQGIIHRDLKPDNILVDLDNEPHILDFGLAKRFEDASWAGHEATISVAGQVVGTLPYASPEQASGHGREVDVCSDIYTLGVILYRLLTGTFPYPVKGDPETVRASILTREPVRFRQAAQHPENDVHSTIDTPSDDLERITLMALAKDKDRRYQSAAALADDLDRYLAGDAVLAKADSSLYMLKKLARRYRLQLAFASAIVVLLAGALAGMTVLWQRADRIGKMAQAGLQAGSYLRLGSAARDGGQVDNAIAMFEKAIEIADLTPTSDSVVQHNHYSTLHALAKLYFEEKQVDKAVPHCNAAIALAEALVKGDPENLEWRRQLGFSYVLRGSLAAAHKEWEQAIVPLRQAVPIIEQFCVQDPENDRHRFDMAFALASLGHYLRKTDQFDESFRCYTEAYDGFRELVRSDPDSLDYGIELTRSETKLSAWHIDQRTQEHYEKALQWLDAAEDRLAAIGASGRLGVRQRDADQLRYVIRNHRQLIAKRMATREKPS